MSFSVRARSRAALRRSLSDWSEWALDSRAESFVSSSLTWRSLRSRNARWLEWHEHGWGAGWGTRTLPCSVPFACSGQASGCPSPRCCSASGVAGHRRGPRRAPSLRCQRPWACGLLPCLHTRRRLSRVPGAPRRISKAVVAYSTTPCYTHNAVRPAKVRVGHGCSMLLGAASTKYCLDAPTGQPPAISHMQPLGTVSTSLRHSTHHPSSLTPSPQTARTPESTRRDREQRMVSELPSGYAKPARICI